MGLLLSGSMMELIETSSKRAHVTRCVSQVCCCQSPSPCRRPLLTHASAGDIQALQRPVWLSICGVSGSWCAHRFVWALWVSLVGIGFDCKHDFSPPTILLGLLLCPLTWGIFFWWDPTFSCWWLRLQSSEASCNFGVLTGEDEHTSFYSAILCLWNLG